MKRLLKVVLVVVVIALVIPLVKYRTVRPCGMLEKELVRRTERTLQAARDSVRRATEPLGEGARETADAVASTVGHLAAGLAAGAAAARVERMSAGECGTELLRLTLRGE